MALFHRITPGASRRNDAWGSGQHGAPRGSGTHHGLDLVTTPGELVRSPIDGEIVREARPYAKDARYRGILIRGTGQWSGYEVKMFYVEGLFMGRVRAGEVVGRAQNISLRYPGITNHVHIEVRLHGVEQSPMDLFGTSF